MLQILSWNIQQGGGSRVTKILEAIGNQGSEIVILSEFRNNKSGLHLRNGMLKLGYWHQFFSGAIDNDNTVAIFSKLPCGSAIFPKCDVNFPHAIIKVSFEVFDIYGVYLPHKKKHELFPFLLDQITYKKPIIIAGDFNTGKNYIDQKGDSFWYSEYLEAFEEKGCVDAFRHVYQDAEMYSWYSHQGNGYRYDHTYIHKSLTPIIKDCNYISKWREAKLSDHSPMVLSLA